jgi:ABC-type polysaccharide/polyol phosphate export permease
MFVSSKPHTTFRGILNFGEVTYHATVHSIRKTHKNAFIAILSSLALMVALVVLFIIVFGIIGERTAHLRGNFILYFFTGIALFFMHVRTVAAVSNSAPPTSNVMQLGPMNTFVALGASAFSALYTQVISILIALAIINVFVVPLNFPDWKSAFFMVLLTWGSGVAVGIVFYSLKPWSPLLSKAFTMGYTRISMFASGKMFTANVLPDSLLPFFSWHPLFHTVDQARGFIFKHYFPQHTTWEYPLYLTLSLVMVGIIIEYQTRRKASASWNA